MTPQEAKQFLLQRTGRHTVPLQSKEEEAVEQLAEALDYLPLALEQAGAYLTQFGASFQSYLSSFSQRGLALLERMPAVFGQYPLSVATTWQLNFEQVEKKSNASADLLRLSDFLHPDSIPLELFTLGVSGLRATLQTALVNVDKNPLVLDELLEPLWQYSLIRRDSGSETYSIHRLVQAVLKSGMDDETQHNWASSTVKALNCAFPSPEVKSWQLCERLILHVQTCADYVKEWKLDSEEAVQLFMRAGHYFNQRGSLDEVEALYRQALAICERILPLNHPATAKCLHELGGLLAGRNRLAEGERMLRRALEIREKTLGEHPDTARSLTALGDVIFRWKQRFNEAEELMMLALMIQEKFVGMNHPDTASILEELGLLYSCGEKFVDAEQCFQQALTIRLKICGPDHPDTGQVLGSLGDFSYRQGKLVEAERCIEQALAVRRKTLGSENPYTAMTAGNLAQIYHAQGKLTDAERLYQEWLTTLEQSVWAMAPSLIEGLECYAELLRDTCRDDEATKLEMRAKEIQAKYDEGNS